MCVCVCVLGEGGGYIVSNQILRMKILLKICYIYSTCEITSNKCCNALIFRFVEPVFILRLEGLYKYLSFDPRNCSRVCSFLGRGLFFKLNTIRVTILYVNSSDTYEEVRFIREILQKKFLQIFRLVPF